jgi:hypothetical protein
MFSALLKTSAACRMTPAWRAIQRASSSGLRSRSHSCAALRARRRRGLSRQLRVEAVISKDAASSLTDHSDAMTPAAPAPRQAVESESDSSAVSYPELRRSRRPRDEQPDTPRPSNVRDLNAEHVALLAQSIKLRGLRVL